MVFEKVNSKKKLFQVGGDNELDLLANYLSLARSKFRLIGLGLISSQTGKNIYIYTYTREIHEHVLY